MGGLSDVQAVYTSFGITADLSGDFTSLSDYGLIIWLMATAEPFWWGDSWSGRIHLSAEYDLWTDTRNYVNGLGLGMTVANNNSGGVGCGAENASPAAHTLTTSITGLAHSATASVSGGTTLFTNAALGLPMMQRRILGAKDFVVSGDSSHLADHCGSAEANKQFLCNLWTYAFNTP